MKGGLMNTQKESIKTQKLFMSLNKISTGYNIDVTWAVDKWLSEPTTLEFIQLWETLHNLDFDKRAYINICSEALGLGKSPSMYDLCAKCHVKGIFLDTEKGDEVFAHKDIAIDFASWVSPAFRTFCLLLMQQDWAQNEAGIKSEEDFVVSSKTLAQYTQANALKNFQSQLGKFVYNCSNV